MIVLDANILLYAYDQSAKQHRKALIFVEQIFSEGVLVGIPWQVASAFLRVVTNARLPGRRFTIEEAIEIVDSWHAQPNVLFLGPGEQHWGLLRRALVEGQISGPLVSDAQIAALAIEHGGELNTTDRDFSRFPGLRWTNPLEN